MKAQTLKQLLKKRYLFVILFAITLMYLFSTLLNLTTAMKNERRTMNESLNQAQINVQTHMNMVEDYLSLTIANPLIQQQLSHIPRGEKEVVNYINSFNETLMSVDLFKKSISTLNLFVFDSNNIYPFYSNSTKYSNAIFSSQNVGTNNWFVNTLRKKGETYWFIENLNGKITVNASRTVIDCSNPSRIFGVIRASIPIGKFIDHLNSLSFGEKGLAFLITEEYAYFHETELSKPSMEDKIYQEFNKHLKVLLPIKKTNWSIMGVASYEILYQNALKNLYLIFIVFLITSLIATFLFVNFSNKLSFPISNLCFKMNKMEKTSLFQTKSSCVEIDQLYHSYNRMLDDMHSLMLAREDALKKLKEAELSLLQAQMNPHFLYNTLESLNALISIGENEKATAMVNNLGIFLRNSLNDNNLIPLKKEIEHVVSYFGIQQIRYSNRIKLDVNISNSVPNYKITKLILQPLVENSIIHGFTDIDYIGMISIHVYEDLKWLFLEVADNGLGTDIDLLNQLLSNKNDCESSDENFYCIQNIQKRLQACFGENSTLQYEENEFGSVTAIIKIDKERLKI